MLSPRQIFEDNIRPADLLLKVFRLLEHDALSTEVALLCSLRELVKAEKDEILLVISNGIFLGLIRDWPKFRRQQSNAAPCAIYCDRPLLPPAQLWRRTFQSC